jgi:hypothetical protein
MKCKKHGCEIMKAAKPGWNGGEEWVCPECAEEKVLMAIKGQSVKPEEKREIPRRATGW